MELKALDEMLQRKREAEKNAQEARVHEHKLAMERIEKASAAARLATEITDLVGYTGEHPFDDILDTRVSSLIPIGKLPTEGMSGFARVVVFYEQDRIEKFEKGFRGKERLAGYEYVKNNQVDNVTVAYYARSEFNDTLEEILQVTTSSVDQFLGIEDVEREITELHALLHNGQYFFSES